MSRKNKHAAVGSVMEKKLPQENHAAVWVSFPQENEMITHPSYTMQIGTAPGAGQVEISVDQGDWIPCREALALWWHDWSGYDAGEHEVVARAKRDDGSLLNSEPRIFYVKL